MKLRGYSLNDLTIPNKKIYKPTITDIVYRLGISSHWKIGTRLWGRWPQSQNSISRTACQYISCFRNRWHPPWAFDPSGTGSSLMSGCACSRRRSRWLWSPRFWVMFRGLSLSICPGWISSRRCIRRWYCWGSVLWWRRNRPCRRRLNGK